MFGNSCSLFIVCDTILNMLKERIKVLYVVESFSTGVYSIIRDIVCNLDSAAFHIHIIHSLRPDSPKDYQEQLQQDNISLEYIAMDSLKTYRKAVGRIRSRIQKLSPDVVHLHSSKGGFLGSLAAKGHPNIFYSPHGFSFLRTDVGFFRRKVFFFLEKLIRKYSGGSIIAVSKGEYCEAERITNSVLLIENFVDISTLPDNTPAELPMVITNGRITYQKNPQLFNAVAMCLPDIRFVWVGDGPLRHCLTSENIEVTGYLSRKDALLFLSQGWVYLQTSKWEGMPVSVLEAMGIGMPSVVTNCIGNRDLIINKKNGYVHDEDDTHGFAGSIIKLIRETKLRKDFGDMAKSNVKKNHSIDIAVKKYSEIYAATLKEEVQ